MSLLLASSLTYPKAIFIGILQGVTELFPVSSLGHSVLIPAWFGWNDLVKNSSTSGPSFYLTFLVGAHLATAAVLFVFFWKEWKAILGGLVTSIVNRKITRADERLGWLLALATIPAGAFGLVFDKMLRHLFARPEAASFFLAVNGIILLAGERLRRRRLRLGPAVPIGSPGAAGPGCLGTTDSGAGPDDCGSTGQVCDTRRITKLDFPSALFIGGAQMGALFAGISRSGITMLAGLMRGLSHEDSARFAFLLATPIIGLAGLYKLPELAGSSAASIRGPILAGSLAAAMGAFVSVRFLVRYSRPKT